MSDVESHIWSKSAAAAQTDQMWDLSSAGRAIREARLLSRASVSPNERIVDLHRAGLSRRAIVVAMGYYEGVLVSEGAVRHRLRREGLAR